MNKAGDVEIKHSTYVKADPDTVYDAIATSEGIDGWFTDGAVVDAHPGGKIKFRWVNWRPDMGVVEDGGPVLEADRGKRFVFQWYPAGPSYPTTVEMTFEPYKDGTIMRVREYGYKDDDTSRKAMLDCAAGWGEALTLLKFYVEHNIRYWS
ncbi:MAG: SRPBCC domain-containing protein [Candidatus Thorarchaeota archaeon]